MRHCQQTTLRNKLTCDTANAISALLNTHERALQLLDEHHLTLSIHACLLLAHGGSPIFKSLVLFMLPILVSNLFQQLYNTVDTMIVGNVLGDEALAAIGACGSIYELLVGFGLGIGNSLAIVAARSYGAQDEDLLKKTVAGSLIIGLAASVLITLAGLVGLHPLLVLLDTPAEILEEAYGYIHIIDLGVLAPWRGADLRRHRRRPVPR